MLIDPFSRALRYLRVSLTDRCNLRCLYCMPEEGVPSLSHEQILRFEEIEAILHVAVRLGVTSIRLTGGEPLASWWNGCIESPV
jgi:cyclic pyranopterin phosphate synthase